VKRFARFASCAPLRCMMFLNLECPAMLFLAYRIGVLSTPHSKKRKGTSKNPFLAKSVRAPLKTLLSG
jgi:hypothetical protein